MTTADLLPSNATQLERDLSCSSDLLPKLGPGAERIRTAKRTNIPDDVVPWLIYEYGLGEILPFVPDLRQALADGVQWQRVRGTRRAVEIGLAWVDFEAEIEESEAGTLRWADYQLGLDQAPNGLDSINSVIEISRLSSPVRSRMFRVYGGYDHRRFRLDDHLLSGGSWLCDDTGVYLREDWPHLSFGRQFTDATNLTADAVFSLAIERQTRTDGGIYEDRNILSCSVLDELEWRTWHLQAEQVTISRNHFNLYGPWWQPSAGWAGLVNRIQPALRFAKAGIYLSDGAVLGNTNACFSPRYEAEFGFGALQLSEGSGISGEGVLSEHVSRFEYAEILERLERAHQAEALEDRQGIAGVTLLTIHATVADLTLFGSWLTRGGWTGYWNESTPLIASAHETST